MKQHSNMTEFLTRKALHFKKSANSVDGFEMLTDEDIKNSPVIKNVCARLTVPLIERMEEATGILDCSKREFIEAAIIEALEQFEAVADEWDIYEPHTRKQSQEEK